MAVEPGKRRHRDEAAVNTFTPRAGLLPRERSFTNAEKTNVANEKTLTNTDKTLTNEKTFIEGTEKAVPNDNQRNNSPKRNTNNGQKTNTNNNTNLPVKNGGEGENEEEVVAGERAKLTHEKVDVRPTKNIKMKQHLCVKHALPKTRLTNAILYENVSQGRHLEMKLAGLQHDKHRSLFNMDLNKRAFMAQQDRKRHKWKREDEVRISGMNLPSFTPEGGKPRSGMPVGSGVPAHRRPSVETIYHMSGTDGRAESAEAGRKPLLPMMKVWRERTEIVSHHDKVFVTKLPAVVEVDQHKLNVHNSYCGKTLMNRGMPSRDDRFRRLHTTLSPAILTGEDEYPLENQTTKSRLSKYVSTSPAVSEPLPPRPQEARVMVASRGKPNAQGLDFTVSSAPGGQRTHAIDFVTERKRDGKDIIDMFRSKDIKTLARSLTTDAAGMRVGMGAGGGRGDETDRSVSKPRPHNIFVPVVDLFYKVKTGR